MLLTAMQKAPRQHDMTERLRRVLIVSPHFLPSNTPDFQRVRISLPYLAEFGWCATVLAVAPEYVDAPQDALLQKTIPEQTSVVRTAAVPLQWTRLVGFGGLALRALP